MKVLFGFIKILLITSFVFSANTILAQKRTKKPVKKDEIKICTEMKVVQKKNNPYVLASVALKDKTWETGQTLTIKFLDGSNYVKTKVKEKALIWTKYANIKFNFVTSGNADIRVSFLKPGSWSYVGKDALYITDQTQPTINFGWFNDSTQDAEFKRTTIHEFGHTLGLVHEHQNPEAGIPWNKQKVYDYYMKSYGWDKDQVDLNLFKKYTKDETKYSKFDKDSIMIYAIPKELTDGSFEVGWNNDLSKGDIEFIGKLYPFDDKNKEIAKKDEETNTNTNTNTETNIKRGGGSDDDFDTDNTDTNTDKDDVDTDDNSDRNTDNNKKTVVADNFKSVSFSGGVTVSVPSEWTENGDNMYMDSSLGNSVNLQIEESSLNMSKYVTASLKEMKKSIPSYEKLGEYNKKINGMNVVILDGKFSMYENDLRLYSVIFDGGNTKYVLTVGGLNDYFESYKDVFNKIIESFKLNTEETEVDTGSNESESDVNYTTYTDVKGVYSFKYPSNWTQSKGKIMWTASNGSSVNLIPEASTMRLSEYVKASIKNMKASIPSYELINQESKKINGITTTILYGKFNMYNNDLRIYSVIYDGNGIKYVLTLGGLDSNFDNDNPTFQDVIESFKLLY